MRQLDASEFRKIAYALSKTYFHGPITGGFAATSRWSQAKKIFPLLIRTHNRDGADFLSQPMARILGGKRDALRQWNHHRTRPAGCRSILPRPRDRSDALETERDPWIWNSTSLTSATAFNQIAKESEEIPIQYAPSRTVGAAA